MIDGESARRAIAEFMTMQFWDSMDREMNIDLSIKKVIQRH